ncbi:ATP-dependent DNA helicase RecG [Desulfitibacter alkalitolerans]|uniref:ATP-dependent DNA helicase RecG n=1 Tax=Desulfitibacter alkalitolerans TaxID=264641 RepID=UPI000480EFC9|nr:ATP-dependent DNA helicase RecG [Desulfitibacter alkalitolerans]
MYDLSNISIDGLKGVGRVKKRALNNLGISTVADILYHFPRKYEDRSNLKKIHELLPGSVETIKGTIVTSEITRPKPRFNILKVVIYDGGSYLTVNWFNQGDYLKNILTRDKEVIVTGKVRRNFGRLEMSAYDYEIIDGRGENLNCGGIIPFYPSTGGLNQRFLRSLIKYCLDNYLNSLPEVLPNELIQPMNIPPLQWCVLKMHFPDTMEEQEKARMYLAYREFAFYQLGILTRKKSIMKNGIIINNNMLVQEYIRSLPFKLTAAQIRVWKDISKDLKSTKPMTRLLQGDVGSGKTVIAVMSLIASCDSGFQGVLMAPTEILARQHYLDLKETLGRLNLNIALLTGSLAQLEKKRILELISSGEIDIVIGTHAIIQDNVMFKRLGLIVIDEQHRFGVNQRLRLQQKADSPNVLVMSATPIPRTLALTLYGDLDISLLDEKPLGRGNVITKYVSEQNRKKLYDFVKKQIQQGKQAYVICPIIDESEKLDIENAVKMEKVLKEVFTGYSVSLVHGRMTPQDKEEIMGQFRAGNLNILISTTVVEVGINVPNANVMIIEGVERFGLSQLHQLRGRISRSKNEAYCFLLGDIKGQEAKYRTKAMCETNDGFKIAEMDLKLRGPGEMFGTRQHGIPEFKVADLITDGKILEASMRHVRAFIEEKQYIKAELFGRHTKFMNIDFSKIYG